MTIGYANKLSRPRNKMLVTLISKDGGIEYHLVAPNKQFKTNNGDTLIVNNNLKITRIPNKEAKWHEFIG